MNDKSLAFFEKLAVSSTLTPNSVKLAKNSDFSHMDAAFILNYADESSTVLDLGTGTGLVVNKLYPHVKKIVAVEPFPQLTQYIAQHGKIRVVNRNVFNFETDEKFDLICLFALMHYMDELQAEKIYKKYIGCLAENGVMIVKNQFGLAEDVTVDGYSEELEGDYFAQYRQVDKEVRLLKDAGFSTVEVADIYPAKYSRWQNTHFFALVATR